MTTTKQDDDLHPVRYGTQYAETQDDSLAATSGSWRARVLSHGVNRLTQISSAPTGAGVPPVSFNYGYNSANQRTQDKLADGSYWVYEYDSLGQVTTGHKYFYDNTPVPGQQFDYTFDTIGNRQWTKSGGDQTGGNQRLANYTVNSLHPVRCALPKCEVCRMGTSCREPIQVEGPLSHGVNQITSRDYPGTNDVIGAALATNSVTVNGSIAFRKGEYFWGVVATNNLSSPQRQQVTVASGGNVSSGGLFVPQTPEQFSYDADGNLTNDGHWAYTWDGENRLVAMTNNTGVGPLYGLTFAYDAKGRRIQKTVVSNSVALYADNYLYDGWNLVAILNSPSSIIGSFTWGNDLSGSAQGAGGVGGLLEETYYGTGTTNCFVAYDGNGNVAELVNAADGTVMGNYEYGPFGEVIRQTGPMAKANHFRFSTKYQDDESDLLVYPYRPYRASTGCWLSRDQAGDPAAYCFVKNKPTMAYDALGLWGEDVHYVKTVEWLANDLNMPNYGADRIAWEDNETDSVYSPYYFTEKNWSWHFNRSKGGAVDSRLEHAAMQLLIAKMHCNGSEDDWIAAATALGEGLHASQDWVAHADFNRYTEAPYIADAPWWEMLHYAHNYFTPIAGQSYKTVDDPVYDADGPDGRATFDVLKFAQITSVGDRLYWTKFHPGSQRITLTQKRTKDMVGDFQDWVRTYAKPCGECRRAFLGSTSK